MTAITEMNTIEHPAFEQHYSPAELAKIWGWSVKTVQRMFADDPNVLVLGRTQSLYGKKRAYATIRIPKSVAVRAWEKKRRGK